MRKRVKLRKSKRELPIKASRSQCSSCQRIEMEELSVVETYLRFGRYPDTYSKGEKANLRRKCHNNYQFSNGVLYYKRAVNGNKSRKEEENWRRCVRTEEEKQRILESCHAGAEGVVVPFGSMTCHSLGMTNMLLKVVKCSRISTIRLYRPSLQSSFPTWMAYSPHC